VGNGVVGRKKEEMKRSRETMKYIKSSSVTGLVWPRVFQGS
jgi:hypothetical protein